jgi:hypothetical protein
MHTYWLANVFKLNLVNQIIIKINKVLIVVNLFIIYTCIYT